MADTISLASAMTLSLQESSWFAAERKLLISHSTRTEFFDTIGYYVSQMEHYPRGDIYSGAYEKIADYSIFAFYESWRQEHAQMSLKYFATYIKSLYLKSGKDLLERLNAFDDRLLCSLVHKFGKRGSGSSETDYEKYIEDLKNALPKDFSAKGDIVVFVDECHRTQSGKLHEAMKAILPNAIFIGFTGTPLLKKDKKDQS